MELIFRESAMPGYVHSRPGASRWGNCPALHMEVSQRSAQEPKLALKAGAGFTPGLKARRSRSATFFVGCLQTSKCWRWP